MNGVRKNAVSEQYTISHKANIVAAIPNAGPLHATIIGFEKLINVFTMFPAWLWMLSFISAVVNVPNKAADLRSWPLEKNLPDPIIKFRDHKSPMHTRTCQ
jgi:hypothetical protein